MHFWQLPVLINEASQQKYTRYTVYESWTSTPKAKLPKRDARNPFDCLNRYPHATGKSTYANLKSIQLSRSRLDNSPSLDFSLIPTLPPLTSVTAPKGSTLKAFEEVHCFAREYLRRCGEEVGEQLGHLRRLHGSVSSLNGRMEELARSGVVVLDPVLNMLFESLQAEVALREERMHEAASHFRKAEFYSLKMHQYLFAGHCLIEEADIYKSEGKLERGLGSLKKALGVAIECGNEELQLSVLEKMGMLYYYNGNTAAGEQYHRLAERGLNANELEMFNQFSLQAELRLLEEELFSLAPSEKPKTKQFTRYDAEVNSDLQAESAIERNCEVAAMVAHMLKDSREKNTGAKLKKHIKNTLSLAKIIPHSQSPPLSNSKENLPFVNVSQVLKSHLSRNRGGTRCQRDWQIRTLLQMIDSLARYLP